MFLISAEVRFLIFENKSISQCYKRHGRCNFSFQIFFERLKVNHTFAVVWRTPTERGRCVKVMFADILGSAVNRILGVKFHLLNYFLGLIFF